MDRDHAEQQLDRELGIWGEAPGEARERVEVRRHRVFYALPVVIIAAAIGGTLSYLVMSFTIQASNAPGLALGIAALAVALVSWGVTGIDRGHAGTSDRMIDAAVCMVVGGFVIGLVRPTPIWAMFALKGMAGMPRFFDVFAWSAAWACVCVAVSSFVRYGLQK